MSFHFELMKAMSLWTLVQNGVIQEFPLLLLFTSPSTSTSTCPFLFPACLVCPFWLCFQRWPSSCQPSPSPPRNLSRSRRLFGRGEQNQALKQSAYLHHWWFTLPLDGVIDVLPFKTNGFEQLIGEVELDLLAPGNHVDEAEDGIVEVVDF